MNDQQLLDTLRGLDHPVMPERGFTDGLYAVLERRVHPRRGPSRQLLVAAALLAAAAVGTAIIVGSRLLQEEPVVVAPSDAPTTAPYTVTIPDGSAPDSSPEEVAAASAILGTVRSMTYFPKGSVLPAGEGLSEPLEGGMWEVVVFRSDEEATYLLSDDSLRVAFLGAAPTPEPTPEFVPLPSWDPGDPLELVSDLGRTIRPTIIGLPNLAPGLVVGTLTAVGDIAWASVTDMGYGEVQSLLRLDTRSGTASLIPLPEGVTVHGVIAGGDTLWLVSSSAAVHALDPVTGEFERTLLIPANGGFIGADEDGLWFRIAAGVSASDRTGAALVDPVTGAIVRRIYTPEEDGAYRGFFNPPAFGSLWDVDRRRALVLRIDAVTGAITAEIDLTAVMSAEEASGCLDPEPGTAGVAELESRMIVFCGAGEVVIDPVGNEILEVIPFEPGMFPPSFHVGIGGQLWVGSWLAMVPEQWSPVLTRFDPATRLPVEIFTFNRERLGGQGPLVVGDNVWLVVGEHAYDGDPYRQNQVLLRIPVAELHG